MTEPALDLSALRNVLASLDGGLGVVSDSAWFSQQPAIVQDTLTAGMIQTFEFVYDISIKMLRRQIESESDSPAEIDAVNFRDLLRIAGEKGLIADVDAWFRYRKMRTLTAHTYDREEARQVYCDTLIFIRDARSLLVCLEARNG